MVNGWVIIGTVLVYNNGLMVLNMRVNGKIMRHVVKVYFNMLMAIYIKELGKIIRQMDMVYINIKMVSNMRDSGRMIINMDLEKKCVHIFIFLISEIKKNKIKKKKGPDNSYYVG